MKKRVFSGTKPTAKEFKKFFQGRVVVFIDAANILYSQKDLGWRVDYLKLKKYFERLGNIVGFYFYTGFVGEFEKQAKFLRKLEKIGYAVKAKEVKRIKISKNTYLLKANLDVELGVDIIALASNFDTLVLFSGDSDFAYVLDLLRNKGKQIVVISTRGHISKELAQRGKFIDFNKLQSKIKFKEK